MCGITGFLARRKDQQKEDLIEVGKRMSMVLSHRGPDDSGLWWDEHEGVVLGFRRLSILDLSPTGHQPMLSTDGRFVIVFNGEIYNFLEEREVLCKAGITFSGSSDTEVMLASIRQWGIIEAVKRFNGMFAFGLWDRQEKCLYLARDRVGIKPLYYGWMGQTFLFGSELKALVQAPDFDPRINRNAMLAFFRFGYIPTPLSIYQNIYKLEPGTILRVRGLETPGNHQKICYWSANTVVEESLRSPFLGDEREATLELDLLIRRSVRERMIADVPLGAFLSGGIDSSTIVALMQAQSTRPVETFTIGFQEEKFNEAVYAKAVARHLQTNHTELYVNADKAMQVITRLPDVFDEPFGDSSQIPTLLVAQLARNCVTVSLSGDGGDELFGGYTRYVSFGKIWKRVTWFSDEDRSRLSQCLRGLLRQDRFLSWFSNVMPARSGRRPWNDKLQTLLDMMAVQSLPEHYPSAMFYHCNNPQSFLLDKVESETPSLDPSNLPVGLDFVHLLMFIDFKTYLPDDILAKVDRASMAVSLEARVPFLDDHRIIEFAWRLPLSMKIQRSRGKRILRQVLTQYVPKNLIERPKMGFLIPIDTWLRGPLLDWAEALLDEYRLRQEGLLNPKLIRKKWEQYLSNAGRWQHYLWDVLMFQAWLDVNRSRNS